MLAALVSHVEHLSAFVRCKHLFKGCQTLWKEVVKCKWFTACGMCSTSCLKEDEAVSELCPSLLCQSNHASVLLTGLYSSNTC